MVCVVCEVVIVHFVVHQLSCAGCAPALIHYSSCYSVLPPAGGKPVDLDEVLGSAVSPRRIFCRALRKRVSSSCSCITSCWVCRSRRLPGSCWLNTFHNNDPLIWSWPLLFLLHLIPWTSRPATCCIPLISLTSSVLRSSGETPHKTLVATPEILLGHS